VSDAQDTTKTVEATLDKLTKTLRLHLKSGNLKLDAESGDAKAQYYLGFCYYYGEGITKDDHEAVKWFRKAAEQGNAEAKNNLGVLYSNGQGVPKDDVEAYKWLNLAAADGIVESAKNRDSITKIMTPDQIAEAQRLSREWMEKNKKEIEN
jgi:TPR repeat protein